MSEEETRTSDEEPAPTAELNRPEATDPAAATAEPRGDTPEEPAACTSELGGPTSEEPATPTIELDPREAIEPTAERPAVGDANGTESDDAAEDPKAASPASSTATAVAPTPVPAESWGAEQAAATASPKPSPAAGAREFIAAHKPLAIGSVALLAVVVALLAVAGFRAASIPANDVIIADARTRVNAPDYDGGTWGDASELRVVNVEVKSVDRSKTAIESGEAQFGASGYATAKVLVTFENGSVRASKEATLGYAKVSDNWCAIGSETDTSVSYEPTAGVSETKLRENVAVLLDRAEQKLDTKKGELSLAGIYANGQVDVTASDYDADAKTDAVTLSCAKTSAFDSYACQVQATFSFRSVSGLWEITDISVPSDAKARGFSPLLGTWSGTFRSQETDGGKCLAAADSPLSITFSAQQAGATDGKGAQVTGTISCLAHFHGQPSRDSQATTGDEALAGVALTATCGGSSTDTITFTGTLPDQAGGKVTVELDFGSADDAGAATAKVTTSYEKESSFLFIPYTETVTYTDTYLLRKQ